MNTNTKPSSFYSIYHNISSLFGIEENEIKEISIPSKAISKRENYHKILHDEIILEIFKLLPGQTRLSTLPHVCYQFYVVSRPFSEKCLSLHYLIPKVEKSVVTRFLFRDYEKIHIFQFRKNQELSLYTLMYGSLLKKIKLSSSEFESYVNSLKKDENNFDILTINNQLKTLSFQHHVSKKLLENATIHNLISKTSSKTLSEFGELQDCKLISMLSDLDAKTLENIALRLIEYGKKTFEDRFAILELQNCLFEEFDEKHKQAILNFDNISPLPLLQIMGISIPPDLVKFGFFSLETCVAYLKEKIEEAKELFNFKCNHKTSLFFIKRERKNGLPFLEQLPPHDELAEEHQWFADRVIKMNPLEFCELKKIDIFSKFCTQITH